jgi:hypothetical protein
MRYVVGIDIGIRNLGLCVHDVHTRRIVYWKNCALLPPSRRIRESENVAQVRAFLQEHAKYLDHAVRIVVEQQMRCSMKAVQWMIHISHFGAVQVIRPRDVKRHYQISASSYDANKKAAVAWARARVNERAEEFDEECIREFLATDKKDDLADALMLVRYVLDTYTDV